MAAGTIGIRTVPTGNPRPVSAIASATPDAASRPKADPPDKTNASTFFTRRSGASRSVSLVPGAPPMTCTAAVNGCSAVSTVVPDLSAASEAFPDLKPFDVGDKVARAGFQAEGIMMCRSHASVFPVRPAGGDWNCRSRRFAGVSGEADYTSFRFRECDSTAISACSHIELIYAII